MTKSGSEQSSISTTKEALAFFDSLESVDIEFMIGQWRGEGYPSNHPLDGLLETYNWHGKNFVSSEVVHPLVFKTLRGGLTHINPGRMAPFFGLIDRVSIPKSKLLGQILQCLLPLFSTSKPRARLRMTEFRGKTSATMIYDQMPINDVFRKLNDRTVLGVMDHKGMDQPFFFKLTREETP